MILFFFSVPFWEKYSEIVEKTNPGPGLWDYPPNHVHRESSLWQLSPTSWAAKGLQLWGKGRVQLLSNGPGAVTMGYRWIWTQLIHKTCVHRIGSGYQNR